MSEVFDWKDIINLARKKIPVTMSSDDKCIEKIREYKELLKVTDRELAKMIKQLPSMLTYDVLSEAQTSIKSKWEFYKKEFAVTDAGLLKMVIAYPKMLSLGTDSNKSTSVKSKKDLYKKTLGLTDGNFSRMVQTLPTLLGYDITATGETSMLTKMKYLKSIGVGREDIIKNPTLLTHPATRLRLRYMIASFCAKDSEIFGSKIMTISEQTLYARWKYLEEKSRVTFTKLGTSHKKFEKMLGIGKDELLGQYPFGEKAIDEVCEKYENMTGKSVKLDKQERDSLLK